MAAPRVAITDLPEQTAPVASNLLVIQDGGVTKKMTLDKVTTAAIDAVNAHVSNPTGAHIASAIAATPNTAPLVGSDVQSQLGQAAAEFSAMQARLTTLIDGLAARVSILEQRP